ncbi:type 4 pilus major pilin [Alcaligenaceae bacterium A4P071]|nr:type 4 pilus major pilin [Alcaligenaceae bacterium A4P071]
MFEHPVVPNPHQQQSSRQSGFSLIEVSIVTAIVLLIAIVGIPAIGNYVIENKVPKVGEALQRFVARTKANAQGIGTAPYAGMGTGVLANAMRDSSVVSVSGDGDSAIVAHNLGGNGTSGNGTITLAPSAVAGGALGSGFTLTLDHVSHAACPGIASVMQRMAEIIRVGGSGGDTVVKDATLQPPMVYNAALADARCARGDVNTFSFVVR